MKPNKLAYLALFSLIASCSSTPPGQRSVASFGGVYDGPKVDVNIINHPPAQYGYCDRYASQTAKHVLACAFGLDEASRMAERFGGGHGRLEGYFRGYSWGMYKMVDAYDSDETEMASGARAIDGLGGYFESAVETGKTQGRAEAGTRGGADARARFYNAVDKGTFPSAEVKIPLVSYQGETNAYARFIGKIPTVEDILSEDSNLNELRVYHEFDRTYLGEAKILRSRDLWFEDGVYRYQRDTWYDPQSAFNTWLTIPLETKAKYQNLNVDVPVDPATGAPVADYQAVFRDAFMQSYAYYVNYAFSREFHTNLTEGQRQGEEVGIQVGKRIAYQRGLARAFDVKYQEVSKSSFHGSFGQAYTESFGETFNFYKNNSVLDLVFSDVMEADRDGVMQPGEAFSARFKVTNVGGVASPLQYTVSGDVVDPQAFSDSIRPLSSKVITSPIIAKIDPRLSARQIADIDLTVNNLHANFRQQVNRLIEVQNYSQRSTIFDGSGQIQVVLNNISQVTAPGKITLELFIQGKLLKTVFGSKMDAGDDQTLVLDYAGLDPLFIIMKGLGAEVRLKYNDVVFDTRKFTIGGNGDIATLTEYYDLLINDRGFVPDFIKLEDRIVEVRNILIQQNTAQVANLRDSSGNVYRKNPERTIPGVIARIKAARATQGTRALNEYTSLGEAFAKDAKRFKSFLGIHPKRTAYLKICSQIAGKKLK